MNREDLERLGRALHISIEIDRTGWLREAMEIRFILGPGRTLHPTALRLAGAPDGIARVADTDPLGLCKKYNTCIERIRRLRERCTHAVANQKGPLDLSSPLLEAFQVLQNFEDELVARQYRYMGSHIVNPETLDSEISYFENLATELASPIDQAEDTLFRPVSGPDAASA
jgi:hypothetical protein